MRRETTNLDVASTTGRERGYMRCDVCQWSEGPRAKVVRAGRDGFVHDNSELSLTPLDRAEHAIAETLDQSHSDVGVTLGVAVQERGKHILDHLRRSHYV